MIIEPIGTILLPNWITVSGYTFGTIDHPSLVRMTDTAFSISGSLMLKEQAAAEADLASYGQIWVKDASPCELWFTDDTGTDFQIGGTGAGEKVKIDVGAVADYIGAAAGDGVLRTGTSLAYADGGDFVTLNTIQGIRTIDSPQFANLYVYHPTSAAPLLVESLSTVYTGFDVKNAHADGDGIAERWRLMQVTRKIGGYGGLPASAFAIRKLGADNFCFSILDTGETCIGVGAAKTKLTVEGSITLKEQANADGDTAAYGQIWAKTAAPCELWFTNDVGTDLRIAPQDLTIAATPQFANLNLGIGEVTCGSINRAAGTLTLEIGGTPQLSITATTAIFAGKVGVNTTPACQLDVDGAFRIIGSDIPATGEGIEYHFIDPIGYMFAYDRDASAYREFRFYADPIGFYDGADRLVATIVDDAMGVGTAIPATKFQTVGACRFGDQATNYTALSATGVQTMTGSARTYNAVWIQAGGIKAPGLKPATEIPHGVLETPAWQFADQAVEGNQESVSFIMRIPEKLDRTGSPSIFIGWSADGAGPGNCEWQLEYLWTAANESTVAGPQDTHTITVAASAVANGLVLSDISGLDSPSGTDACLHCKLTRLSAGGNDTIVDTVELHGVCLYFITNKIGKAL